MSSWLAVALVETGVAAFSVASIAFGPLFRAPRPWLWLLEAMALLAIYLSIALWSTRALLTATRLGERPRGLLLSVSSLPFLAAFSFALVPLLFRPSATDGVRPFISQIQPFPILGAALGLLLVFLLKALVVSAARPTISGLSARLVDGAVAAAMLLLGVLQASVFITPIGNAFLRFWAIADAFPAGMLWSSYPVTLTESAPVAAGSPPYVYDLPLFPLMLQAVFGLLGHDSAAAHLPAAFWSALFPLSLYLLIREMTGSRATGILFSALASLFPYLRLWVLNLPDPDPLLLTSLCLAAYLYLSALGGPVPLSRWEKVGMRATTYAPWIQWALAGIAAGVLSLARPEGLLYAGCLALGVLACRPGIRRLAPYTLGMLAFIGPAATLWMANFGFLWPQNYNRTLGPDFPMQNYQILVDTDALGFYRRGLGLDERWAVGLLLLFIVLVLLGTLMMAFRDRRLLAIAVPSIGNTVVIFFANPAIPNTHHFVDFFRHASFGIPFLVAIAAYACHRIYLYLADRRLKAIAYAFLLLLVASVVREGDILANPTATHRSSQSWPAPTQVLPTYTHLSMQAILEHPLQLPSMTYDRRDGMTIARLTFMAWPEDSLAFFKPLDMSFESGARPFAYASVVAFLVALGFALLAGSRFSPSKKAVPAGGVVARREHPASSSWRPT